MSVNRGNLKHTNPSARGRTAVIERQIPPLFAQMHTIHSSLGAKGYLSPFSHQDLPSSLLHPDHPPLPHAFLHPPSFPSQPLPAPPSSAIIRPSSPFPNPPPLPLFHPFPTFFSPAPFWLYSMRAQKPNGETSCMRHRLCWFPKRHVG